MNINIDRLTVKLSTSFQADSIVRLRYSMRPVLPLSFLTNVFLNIY